MIEVYPQAREFPLSDEGYHLANVYFNWGKVGTVFGGEAQLNLTLGEFLRKQATF